LFYQQYSYVGELKDILNAEHPRYGEKRVRNTLIENVIVHNGWDYEEGYEDSSIIVDTYLTLVKLGFLDVYALDIKAQEAKLKLDESTEVMLKETADKVVGAGKKVASGVVSVAKPYGEVAKGQLNDAKVVAKKLVNNGAKRLVKVLKRVEEKTNSNEE